MPLFWFLAGMLTALAALSLLFPWLRTASQPAGLLATPKRAAAGAVVLVAAIFALHALLDGPGAAVAPTAPAAAAASGAADTAVKANAGSMDRAIVNLEGRLAKGGGTEGDWELLAKSFEFLGRPQEAADARAHRLPASAGAPGPAAAAGGVVVSGEVMLDASLRGRAAAGETLFIVAKSVDSPGVPVAAFRGTVEHWPVKFTLDDSQSMMPGRNLSAAGRVTVEARISRRGQPLPAPGDLQGSSGVIDPSDHKPLRITIDHEIS